MTRRSPIGSGFRAIWRTPALAVAEIAWRWSFMISALLLVFLALIEFLRSVEVPDSDKMFLHSGNLLLTVGAFSDLFRGSGTTLLRIAAILVPALVLLWTFAAALGRAATLNVLLPQKQVRVRTLVAQSFLRSVLTLAAVICVLGGARLAGNMIRPERSLPINAQIHVAVVFSLMLLVVVATIWSALNWLLSLAAVFVALDGRDAMEGIRDAVAFLRQRTGALVVTNTLFGLLHLGALIAATIVGLAVVSVASSPWAGVGATVVILGYLVLVDALYIARMAAYVAIADEDRAPGDQPHAQFDTPPVPAVPMP